MVQVSAYDFIAVSKGKQNSYKIFPVSFDGFLICSGNFRKRRYGKLFRAKQIIKQRGIFPGCGQYPPAGLQSTILPGTVVCHVRERNAEFKKLLFKFLNFFSGRASVMIFFYFILGVL